jgi:hypothetical protein
MREFIFPDNEISEDGHFIGETYVNFTVPLIPIDVQRIVFPKTLLHIPNCICCDYKELEEVVFSPDLQSIGKDAFAKCQKLKFDISTFNLKKLTRLGDSCFFKTQVYCGSEVMVFPESYLSLGYGAFRDCHKLKDTYVFFSKESVDKLEDPQRYVDPFDGVDVIYLKKVVDHTLEEELGLVIKRFINLTR